MPTRNAFAVWEGDLLKGKGKIDLESGAFKGNYSFTSRFENGTGTNPEELIGAAHAGCFSMALAHGLAQAGYVPKRIQTSARVNLAKVDAGYRITTIELHTQAEVPDIEESKFLEFAESAKQNCPVSQLLTGADIRLQAKLVG